MTRFLILALLLLPAVARAGYEPPCFVDGCQSEDGRYIVTAEPVGKIQNHGPNRWKFIWKDTKTGKAIESDAKGVQGGQIFAHLFIAPDGETFALWNHMIIYSTGKSDMHGAAKLWDPNKPGRPANRLDETYTHRLIVYRKDGTVVKTLGIGDFLSPAEWEAVGIVFNRINWLVPYDNLKYRDVARFGYAFYRVSPDYSLLEFQVAPPPGAKAPDGKTPRSPRVIRVSLSDGRILADDDTIAANKLPIRPFKGPDHLPDSEPKTRESFTPSLDPVRIPGKLGSSAAPPPATLALVKDGFKKLDTPAWLPNEKRLLFTDLEAGKLFRLDPATKQIAESRTDAGRGKVGPDGRFYGMIGGKLAAWRPGEDPRILLEKAANGNEISLNDLAIAANGMLYFTTLKDPERGRLTIVNLQSKTPTIAYDANEHPELSNPNGLAVSPDSKSLYLAVSNYKDRRKAGLYRFSILSDGSLDLAAGKKQKWATVNEPDGVAVGPDGTLFCTDGALVREFSADGVEISKIRLPKDSGTNLTFGGIDGRTLFVTTNKGLYMELLAAKKKM